MKRISPLFVLVVWLLSVLAIPATASDEFQEAVQQTEDDWQAVRGTLKEGKETLDELKKKYQEYRDAAFSDSPEQGLALARKLFNLGPNDTQAAEKKIWQMRQMFSELDDAGIMGKLEAASGYLDKANGYAGEVQNIWEFTKKFDPENAKDNPTYGLRLIGDLLTESAEKMEAIPLVGEILGKWVKAYGEVAGDFANALDRLSKKIDDFRGGSLCGQLGMRQDQQKAFKKAGGDNCMVYFASGIFPRLLGETYEGNTDYFLFDPVRDRGYLASKEAEIVYRWQQLLLEHRDLDPDWLAARANTLKPEIKKRARDNYDLFEGWRNKRDPGWAVIEKLGLYQDAYFYGRLDEMTFMGNYILTTKHRKAIDAILSEYEKYVLVRGTVLEEISGGTQPAAGAEVEFTVEGRLYSAIVNEHGRYEILIVAQVNDPIQGRVSKLGFETITDGGKMPQKVISGLDYTLVDLSLRGPQIGMNGTISISADAAGNEAITAAVAGQEVHLQTAVTAHDLERSETVSVELQVVLPDGMSLTLQPPGVTVRPGQMMGYSTVIAFAVPQDSGTGTGHVTGTLQLGDQTFPLDGTTFEIEEIDFQIGELFISPGQDRYYLGKKYAIGDAIHLQVDLTGVSTGSAAPITAEWHVTLPDGRVVDLRETRILAAEGVSGALMNDIRTDERNAAGLYRVEVVISLEDSEIARRSGSFELVPLFENAELLITDAEDSLWPVESFRPEDQLFILAKFDYNSVDPSRPVQVSVNIEGPDAAICAMGLNTDQNYDQGAVVTGIGNQVPSVVQEGVYTVTVMLDGGAGQQVIFANANFRVVHPVQFEGIWTRDGSTPRQLKNRFANGEDYEWFMRYRFVEPREGDQYSSALWCHYGDITLDALSSGPLGPDAPYEGPATTTYTGVIPQDMPSATYEVNGVVWYNDVAYYSPGTSMVVGQEPTITITSPQSGFTVDKKVLVVTGTCEDLELTQAFLLTNGESIPIKLNNGRFSAKTVLRPGQNQISVVAENDVGRSEDSVWGTAHIQASALKVVLTWEASGTDVDLWVTDPQGVVTSYKNKKPAEGRTLDVDDRSGPGMETYTIEVPLRGEYGIAVRYYGAGSWSGAVSFDLRTTSWETTFSETHGTYGGTLYEAAGGRDEPGAVEHFTVQLY